MRTFLRFVVLVWACQYSLNCTKAPTHVDQQPDGGNESDEDAASPADDADDADGFDGKGEADHWILDTWDGGQSTDTLDGNQSDGHSSSDGGDSLPVCDADQVSEPSCYSVLSQHGPEDPCADGNEIKLFVLYPYEGVIVHPATYRREMIVSGRVFGPVSEVTVNDVPAQVFHGWFHAEIWPIPDNVVVVALGANGERIEATPEYWVSDEESAPIRLKSRLFSPPDDLHTWDELFEQDCSRNLHLIVQLEHHSPSLEERDWLRDRGVVLYSPIPEATYFASVDLDKWTVFSGELQTLIRSITPVLPEDRWAGKWDEDIFFCAEDQPETSSHHLAIQWFSDTNPEFVDEICHRWSEDGCMSGWFATTVHIDKDKAMLPLLADEVQWIFRVVINETLCEETEPSYGPYRIGFRWDEPAQLWKSVVEGLIYIPWCQTLLYKPSGLYYPVHEVDPLTGSVTTLDEVPEGTDFEAGTYIVNNPDCMSCSKTKEAPDGAYVISVAESNSIDGRCMIEHPSGDLVSTCLSFPPRLAWCQDGSNPWGGSCQSP